MVAVLLVSEIGLRAIDDHLPRETAGDTVEIELKYEQLRALREAGEPVDLLVLGNSTLDAAVDPVLLGQASSRFDAPYNAALLGAPLPAIRRWTTEFVLAECKPDTVVVGLTPLDVPSVDLFGVSKTAVADAFDASLDDLHPTTLQRADRAASDHSVLLKRRALFRAPVELWRGLSDAVHGQANEFEGAGPVTLEDGTRGVRDRATWETELLAPRGGNRTYWGAEFDGTSESRISPSQSRALASSNVNAAEVRALLADLHDANIDDIVLVLPPHDRAALADTGLDLAQFDRLAGQLVALGEEAGVAVIDMSGTEWDHSNFFDPAHLSKRGNDRFTRLLARQLDAL